MVKEASLRVQEPKWLPIRAPTQLEDCGIELAGISGYSTSRSMNMGSLSEGISRLTNSGFRPAAAVISRALSRQTSFISSKVS